MRLSTSVCCSISFLPSVHLTSLHTQASSLKNVNWYHKPINYPALPEFHTGTNKISPYLTDVFWGEMVLFFRMTACCRLILIFFHSSSLPKNAESLTQTAGLWQRNTMNTMCSKVMLSFRASTTLSFCKLGPRQLPSTAGTDKYLIQPHTEQSL